MSKSASKPEIRDLEILADLDLVLRLEKEVWGLEDADVTPITLAVALKAAGSICLGVSQFGTGEGGVSFSYACGERFAPRAQPRLRTKTGSTAAGLGSGRPRDDLDIRSL